MKPERAFVAERAAAQHCPELIGQGSDLSSADQSLPALGATAAKLSRILAGALSPFIGNQEIAIAASAPREATAGDLAKDIAPLAANSLLGNAGTSLLVSFEAGAVLRMIDRAFGGTGKTPAPLPQSFPASAGVVMRQLETVVCQALAAASGVSFAPLRRSGSLIELEAFIEDTALAILTLSVTEPGCEPWSIQLGIPQAAISSLGAGAAQSPAKTAAPRSANPAEEPYCDLPLTLSAVIVDMRLPMSALTELQPGTLLPVSVARNVPLRIGDKTLAHGAIGSVDDRVAIQITQAF